jgi:hypothetical protein
MFLQQQIFIIFLGENDPMQNAMIRLSNLLCKNMTPNALKCVLLP